MTSIFAWYVEYGMITPTRCPFCGSTDIKRSKGTSDIWAISNVMCNECKMPCAIITTKEVQEAMQKRGKAA